MGIQVDPSVTSRYAMARFGEDYTKLVMQCSDLSAFAESAQNEVTRLEKQSRIDSDTISTLEGLLREAGAIKTQLEVENEALEAEVNTLRHVESTDPEPPQ